MTHTLISFLGKARKSEGGKYRTACYQFDTQQQSSQFFGLALNEVIQPDQLIILGTSGSMWDVFYEPLAESDSQQEHWLKLSEAVENNQVTAELLEPCAHDLSVKRGIPCRLQLIPYGADLAQQTEILKIMADNIGMGEQVSLDLTHGLRHLPMLGLLSALYLQTAKQVNIKEMYYGALELTENGQTPVMQLGGLLKIADWINALQGFDRTGDIAPFSDLLQQEGMATDTANLLAQAGFYENTLSITKARKPLKDFASQTHGKLPGIASLFSDSLNERIAWKNENNIYLRQRANALFFLDRGDYLRATALTYEAYITGYIKQESPSADPENYEVRDEHKQRLKKHLSGEKKESFKLLNNLRNALAHGTRSDMAEVQRALADEQSLKQTLYQLLTKLLPETL